MDKALRLPGPVTINIDTISYFNPDVKDTTVFVLRYPFIAKDLQGRLREFTTLSVDIPYSTVLLMLASLDVKIADYASFI